jgi:hypothetical protein
LGALVANIVIIAGIGMSPFFQQSVVLYSANVPDRGTDQDTQAAYASAAFTFNGTSTAYLGKDNFWLGKIASHKYTNRSLT